MSNQQNKTTQSKKENKKRINVVTGAQRRKTSNSKGPSVSNMKTARNNNPSGRFTGNTFRVKKREFILDVVPSSKFTPIKIEINPSLPQSFPWLSGIAPSFQKYRIHKFRVCYEPSQSTVVPGMFMFAPEFNVTDGLPSSKSELLEYSYATRGPIWKSFSKEFSVKDMMQYKDYYVRNSETSNLVLYDPFFLVIATDNVSTDLLILGEIWFEYEIEFSIPQTVNNTTNGLLNHRFFNLGGDFTENKFLGTTVTDQSGDFPVRIDQTQQTFIFDQEFIGQIVIVTQDEIGQANYMDTNPGVLNVSGEVEPILVSAVGGAGYNKSYKDDVWRSYTYSIKCDKGDLLSFGDPFCYNRCTALTVRFYRSLVGN